MDPESIEILNKVKSGELSAEEGARRLQELEAAPSRTGVSEVDASEMDDTELQAAASTTLAANAGMIDRPVSETPADERSAGEVIDMPQDAEPLPDLGWWKKGWLVPFWAGTIILVLSALWMGSAYSSHNFFWFYCSWLPMLFGLLVLFLSWWSQQARWVHVRIKDADGTKVAISLPLPLRLTGRLIHMFGRFIPNMDPRALDNLPEIFDSLAQEKGPTTVEVDEKDGTRVRVYIL